MRDKHDLDPDGIILFDALNNGEEAERYIDGGLRKLGLDPAKIRYLVITHGHGDHYGGASWLIERYRPKVVLSDADWKQLEGKLDFDVPTWGRPPKRDVTIADGQRLTLGDTTVEFHVGAGHTLGTVSAIFPVRDGGRPHTAALWGGVGFNFPPTEERFRLYAASAKTFGDRLRARKADVVLTNHLNHGNGAERLAALKARPPGGPHAFVVENGGPARFMDVLESCATANRARVATAR